LSVRGTWPATPLGLESRRRTGAFHVTINLPAEVDPNGATAQFRHGLLTVDLPKAAGPRRRLDIRVHTDGSTA
jgi:HSP20 family molecular chaperone IbpA